jgi:hypothetical protein
MIETEIYLFLRRKYLSFGDVIPHFSGKWQAGTALKLPSSAELVLENV